MFIIVHVLVCIGIFLASLIKIYFIFHNFIMFEPRKNICILWIIVLSDHLLYLEPLTHIFSVIILFVHTKRALCLISIDCRHGCFSKSELLLFKFFWLKKMRRENQHVAIDTLLSQFELGELDADWLKIKVLNILPIMIFFSYVVIVC